MLRNKVEVTVWRESDDDYVDRLVRVDKSGALRNFMQLPRFKDLFGFTPRPGRKFRITMEIQEEAK